MANIKWAKKELQDAAAGLRRVQAQLTKVVESVQEFGDESAELRLAADTVRNELLGDAITLLQAAIDLNEMEASTQEGDHDDQRRS